VVLPASLALPLVAVWTLAFVTFTVLVCVMVLLLTVWLPMALVEPGPVLVMLLPAGGVGVFGDTGLGIFAEPGGNCLLVAGIVALPALPPLPPGVVLALTLPGALPKGLPAGPLPDPPMSPMPLELRPLCAGGVPAPPGPPPMPPVGRVVGVHGLLVGVGC
jgi:hypothetical protein